MSQPMPASAQARRLSYVAPIAVVGYIAISAALINFNKHLMSKDTFPYPVYLVMYHSVLTSMFAALAYVCVPSLFPTLSQPAEGGSPVDRRRLAVSAAPIALLFAGQLVLSNTSYMHASVAFLQMMKESNVVWVYLLSVLFAMEVFTWPMAQVLVMLVGATFLSVRGELNFSAIGFTVQAISQVFESLKITTQGLLLAGSGRKMDALTYTLVVMPLCFVALAFLVALFQGLGHLAPGAAPTMGEAFAMPPPATIAKLWPLLLLNGLCACSLNVVSAVLVKSTSAVTFVLTGIAKDVCIVLGGAMVMGEEVSRMQVIGFTLQLMMIAVYSTMKRNPLTFKDGVITGLYRCSTGQLVNEPEAEKASLTPETVTDKAGTKLYGAAKV